MITEYLLGAFNVVRNIQTLLASIRITHIFKALFDLAYNVIKAACFLGLRNAKKYYKLCLTEKVTTTGKYYEFL